MCSSSGTAVSTVQIDADALKVTRWDFPAKGSNTGWHKHAFPYVVVPLQSGFLAITDSSGKTSRVELVAGQAYARPAGIEHDVASDHDRPVAFVEVEILETGAGNDKAYQSFLYPM